MRNSVSHVCGSSHDPVPASCRTLTYTNDLKFPPPKIKSAFVNAGYSEVTRSGSMSRNFDDAIQFMEEQESALLSMIDQLNEYLSNAKSTNTAHGLSASYLLSARAIESTLHRRHRGKPLFDNACDKPLRIHLEVDGLVRPVDLPNPQLSGIHSLQGFVLGTGAKSVPSENLVNGCLSDLMDCLLGVRIEKEKFLNSFSRFKSIQRNSFSKSVISMRKSHPVNDLFATLRGGWRTFLNFITMRTA